ncbi:L,D-transpeptidase family protein [Alkaliphilus pronyensis]|uniref:L,D-transpeptidase family protein n=1 Tax=Alkaliphilus pronyensis TaxID=1482732 RepID=A0A6I0F9D6_9FIRM|nr:L,D-transpeptidase family protein [Alkaliphilus pronyensis]KAB3534886.1 L,D-transpeptidase family protein [Alkaliphilus pronyensis]
MTKKVVLLLTVFLIIILPSCGYRREAPEDRLNQMQEEKLNKKDKLAKSNEEAVEENINGFDIEDDLSITESNGNGNNTSCLDQNEKNQLSKSIEPKKINTILHEYNTKLPNTIIDSRQYTQYNISYDYFLITAEEGADVLENPTPDGNIVANVENLQKVSLLQRVEGKEEEASNIWYRVGFANGSQVNEGYVHSTEGVPRSFRFNRMEEAVNQLKQQVAEGELHYISNYKNENGAPPQKGEEAIDQYGYRVYHSAPAYDRADTNSDYRYIPDGMLIRLLGEDGDFYHIGVPTFGGEYYVPKQYIDTEKSFNQLKHVVVIDRDQQNQAAFEVKDNGLNLISYTLSTTGLPGEFSFETTLGSYKAIVKRERFEYLKNGTQEIAGYAPFAIRFTGGAYIHGVPVKYEEENGEKVDPGIIEYLHTIGTFPRSNMCVRNYSSHAEFLYNWMDIEHGAVIVIE